MQINTEKIDVIAGKVWLYYSKSGQHSIKGVAIQQLERKYIVAISLSCKKKKHPRTFIKLP